MRRTSFIILAILTLFIAACGGGGGDGGPTTGTINGTVVDSNSNPVQNLEVDVGATKAAAATDATGAFSLTVGAGDHHVSVYEVLPSGRYLVAEGDVTGIVLGAVVEVALTLTGSGYYFDGDLWFLDGDGDGYSDSADGGLSVAFGGGDPGGNYVIFSDLIELHTDCDDSEFDTNPDATEVCDGVDNNCSGAIDDGLTFTDYYPDTDGDNYGSSSVSAVNECEAPANHVDNNLDCDDGNKDINPDATEVCDNVDNNCSGEVDEGLTFTDYYPDTDGDNYGSSSVSAVNECEAPPNHVDNNLDCDDGNVAINPDATEVCDGLDNSCDGLVDEGFELNAYCSVGIGACQRVGSTVCTSDTLSTECNVTPGDPEAEICDGIDNDCDGLEDDSLTPPSASLNQGVCTGAVKICSGAGGWEDPDYTLIANYEVSESTCDDLDNDCDGDADGGLSFANYYPDVDKDTFGDLNASPNNACAQPVGQVTNNADCNDGNPAINPEATETCDGADNNCDGNVDEDLSFVGTDCDTDLPGECASGTIVCSGGAGYTCQQDVTAVAETCNGLDDDCDGLIDDGFSLTDYYPDSDSDTYGSSVAIAQPACSAPPGHVDNNSDCNDGNSNTYQGAVEICDGEDNDCDGVVPAEETDGDGDGQMVCEGDCDDSDPGNFTGNTEVCDKADNDCDAVVDNGLVVATYYIDGDGDGFGYFSTSTEDCAPPPGYVANNTDCNDDNASIYPAAVEQCDGLDNDCDGVTVGENDLDGDGFRECDDDCDDTDGNNFPGNTEACDGADNDCDAVVDNGLDFNYYYLDFDNDGFGDETYTAVNDCQVPANHVIDNTDCDDGNASVNPDATEIADDGIDNDCDGTELKTIPDPVAINTLPSTTVSSITGQGFAIYSFPVTAGETYSVVLSFTQAIDNPTVGVGPTLQSVHDAILDENFSGLIDITDAPAGVTEAITFTADTTGTYYVAMGNDGTINYTLDIAVARGICNGTVGAAYAAPFLAFETLWATSVPSAIEDLDVSFDRGGFLDNGLDFTAWGADTGIWPASTDLIGISFDNLALCLEDTGKAKVFAEISIGGQPFGAERFFLTDIGGGNWRIEGNQRNARYDTLAFAHKQIDHYTVPDPDETVTWYYSGLKFRAENVDTAAVDYVLFKGPGMPWGGFMMDIDNGTGQAGWEQGLYQEDVAGFFGQTQLGNVPDGTLLTIETYSSGDVLVETYDEWISFGVDRDPSGATSFPVVDAPTPAAMAAYDYTGDATFTVEWTLPLPGASFCLSVSDFSSGYRDTCNGDSVTSPYVFGVDDFGANGLMDFNPVNLWLDQETLGLNNYSTAITIKAPSP